MLPAPFLLHQVLGLPDLSKLNKAPAPLSTLGMVGACLKQVPQRGSACMSDVPLSGTMRGK